MHSPPLDDHMTIEADKPKAMSYFMKAAELGDASAQFFIGHVLHHGLGSIMPQNPVSGFVLLEQAASQGHAGALYYMAQLYRYGDVHMNIGQDVAQFLSYLEKAVALSDPDALMCMAELYRDDGGSCEDEHLRQYLVQRHGHLDAVNRQIEMERYYRLAAAHGNVDAIVSLGALHFDRRQYRRAFQYYQAAAEKHSMAAWKNMADMYMRGLGIAKNEETAQSILGMLKRWEAAAAAAEDI
jgi:TPR repeat protein